jgi:hypothetical protein
VMPYEIAASVRFMVGILHSLKNRGQQPLDSI